MESDKLTKEDLAFLVKIMDEKYLKETSPPDNENKLPKIDGKMDIPKPITVGVNGTMNQDDYKSCSTMMFVALNMIQKTITNAASEMGISAEDALKTRGAWIQAFADFPMPFFNFKDYQADKYIKNDFSITANPDVVENIVNIKGVNDLKDAVVGALKKSGGELFKHSQEKRDFNYFGVITVYNETEVEIRLVDYTLHLEKTVTTTLCGGTEKTVLDSSYVTCRFYGDKDYLIKTQKGMGNKVIDFFADNLLEFIKDFYDKEIKGYKGKLKTFFKK